MKKKRVLALLLVFALALGLAACGSSDSSEAASDASEDTAAATTEEAAPAEDTTEEAAPAEETASSGSITALTVGTANSLGTCFLNDNNGDCYTAIYLVFDSLFSFDPQTKDCYSDVLSDWGYSDDGMTLTMTIKPGVMFSNGQEATAEDVLYSIQNYVDRETIVSAFYTPYDFPSAEISDDGYTVTIPLTTEFSPAINEIGNLPLYCASWAETADSEDWINNPVGSGPYEVVDYVTDSYIEVAKRADYWGDYTSSLETIRINYYAEPATMAMALENGEIDLALELLDNDYDRLQDEDGFAVDTISAGENRIMNFDLHNEILQDENIRLAIAYGVNWEEVNDAADGGISPLATSLIISSSDYYEDVGAYEYDYDKAMEYMNASAYAGQEINMTMISTDEDDQVKMTTVVQAYLADLGINLETEFLDFPSALAIWLEGGTDLMWTDSSIGSIISEPFASLRATSNVTGSMPGVIVLDDEYQALLDEATYTFDPAVRTEAFDELQEYNKENAYVIPVCEEFVAIAWNTDVIESVNILNGTDANLRNLVLK